jgi:PAS domain S-box-containing protein
MNPSIHFDADGDRSFRILWEDGDRIFCRGHRRGANGNSDAVLAVLPATEHPTPATLDRLAHEYDLKDELDVAWAVRPLELVRDRGRTMLVLEDPGSEPLERLLGKPLELGSFLHFAIGITSALGKAHRRGLVHKDIKPANILVNRTSGEVKLTGFGIASRLLRERSAPEPPETIAGTLAYMAPEQTGRMNRSIDARSDLYALGVTLYQMLTGSLPFTASDPMDWVHCHIARKPVPPAERLETIPAPVSAIILKLLAKTAEDRYQTAAGLERDLWRCLAACEPEHTIDAFPLGQQDTPDRLLIPEKLYGREPEIETLLAAFDRIVRSGAPELVLVSGYSGIGKSAVVNELHKVLVPPRGLFASGKFDQYKRDIPYATLAQAFQSLIRPLLGKSDADLVPWRDALREALGPNGHLMVDLVPELKLIIGDQPPIAELPPQDAQRRFQLVFRRFIGVFARPEHPLALFLDDLQWLDAATLDLLEDLLAQADLQHLMLIGAYRDNEVTAGHPLTRKLDAIKSAGGKVAEITLVPLAREHLGQLITDALRCESEHAAPLAQLVHEKTGGNPFFAIQFLSSLAEEGMLTFDHDAAHWSWVLDRIHAKGYSDNVVELLVGKVTRLPTETQQALQQLACLGNIAEITTLSIVLGTSEEQVHAALWPSVRQELAERLVGAYRFVHDRVQEAAYSLIPEKRRGEAHLRIGRLLAARIPPEKRDETIFDIVNQLNRGVALITSRDEREQLAELNLLAGKRAKASTAYASALRYLVSGTTLLPGDSWQRRHKLIFELEMHRAECEFVTGSLAEAEERLAALSTRAATTLQRASVACLRVDLYMTIDQTDRAIAVALDYLRPLGIDWLPHPTEDEARREYERIWSQLGSRKIEELIELPLMTDPETLATVDLLIRVAVPAFFRSSGLFPLATCRAVNLSLEHGNSDASCSAYELFGMFSGPLFGNYDAGFRFGRLGCELVEKKPELKRFQARTLENFGFVIAWTRHVRAGRDLLRRALDIAHRIGDLTYEGLSCGQLNSNLLFAGDPLVEVQREAESGLEFAQKLQFGVIDCWITGQLGLIRSVRGLTAKFGSFDDGRFDELAFERHLSSNPALALPECWYWIRKLQACFLAGDYAAAVDASSRAQPLLWTSMSLLETAEYHFYGALARAASWDIAAASERQRQSEALVVHHRQLEIWAENCPENFENRAALVGAEIARIEGRALDAERLYEEAIRSARANGFVHNEAIAYELAARFYAARRFEQFAHLYLRNARRCYLSWGADGKVRQLDELYPQLREDQVVRGSTSTIGTPVEHLDLATVVKVSQAVSGEIVLEKLIDTLMRTAMAHAGAEQALLILARGDEQRICAEATTSDDKVFVQLRDDTVTAAVLPASVIHYVLRTRESVIIDDAAAQSSFAADSYIRQHQARSVLCLPLLHQAKLIGVLYLENNLASHVFTPARISALELLASQAAISLENARLYNDLGEREARIRRLVDSNIIGIMIWDFQGRIIEANQAILDMLGYSREELISGGMGWAQLTPAEWASADQDALAQVSATGSCRPYEKEYFRKDGSRVPILIAGALFEWKRDEGVAFVIDMTDRKQAEEKLRASEQSLLDAQMELAHVNRVTTTGQLTASIAHEVNQPLAAVIANAEACLRWLDSGTPDLDRARRSARWIIDDGNRASEVIRRVRALAKKTEIEKAPLDVNDVVRETIALVQRELTSHQASLRTEFAPTLPTILGDRVQLQQVIINLVMNAIEAMQSIADRPRELVIRSRKDETRHVLISVTDCGVGISSENADRLFNVFFTTKSSGMGMGLAICRSIIEAHGGRLWATANLPNGATFQFTLPVNADTSS